MNFIGIIPARYASTRFPGKPLVDIGGKPMIQRVYEQAKKVLDTVLVATDDERIYNTVLNFGGQAVMTRTDHKCGTDRCLEAYDKWKSEQEHPTPLPPYSPTPDNEVVIINIQGDEPFIQPEQIQAIMSCFPTEIATLVKPFTSDDTLADLENPNTPKVEFTVESESESESERKIGTARMFSRSVIPYLRGIPKEEWLTSPLGGGREGATFYRHIGMYAYRADILRQITALPQSPLEKAESLEQLRWLENGYQIKVAVCNTYSMGIDTPEDLAKAISYLKLTTNN